MINNLHTIKKPDTFPAFLLNISSLVTFTFNLVLGQGITITVMILDP